MAAIEVVRQNQCVQKLSMCLSTADGKHRTAEQEMQIHQPVLQRKMSGIEANSMTILSKHSVITEIQRKPFKILQNT